MTLQPLYTAELDIGAFPTCEEHVQLSHLGLEVDGSAEEVESRRVLLHRQVD